MKIMKSHRASGILSKLLELVLLLLLVTSLASAQKQQGEAPAAPVGTASPTQDVIKVVHVKYANVDRVARLLDFFHIQMKADSSLKVITLEGPQAYVAAVEEAIRQLDVPTPPTRNIHITAYLLMATRRPPGDTDFKPGDVALPPGQSGTQLPEELREVVKQLQGVMNYHSFRLVHTLTLATTNGGSARISGMTPIGTWQHPDNPRLSHDVQMANIDFSVGRAETPTRAKPDSVSLRGVSLSIYLLPPSTQSGLFGKAPVASFSTDVEVGAKQRVVVGKTDIFNPNLGLFLVISTQVTD
jgi:Bacterial type II/III secretion system short domain